MAVVSRATIGSFVVFDRKSEPRRAEPCAEAYHVAGQPWMGRPRGVVGQQTESATAWGAPCQENDSSCASAELSDERGVGLVVASWGGKVEVMPVELPSVKLVASCGYQ